MPVEAVEALWADDAAAAVPSAVTVGVVLTLRPLPLPATSTSDGVAVPAAAAAAGGEEAARTTLSCEGLLRLDRLERARCRAGGSASSPAAEAGAAPPLGVPASTSTAGTAAALRHRRMSAANARSASLRTSTTGSQQATHRGSDSAVTTAATEVEVALAPLAAATEVEVGGRSAESGKHTGDEMTSRAIATAARRASGFFDKASIAALLLAVEAAAEEEDAAPPLPPAALDVISPPLSRGPSTPPSHNSLGLNTRNRTYARSAALAASSAGPRFSRSRSRRLGTDARAKPTNLSLSLAARTACASMQRATTDTFASFIPRRSRLAASPSHSPLSG